MTADVLRGLSAESRADALRNDPERRLQHELIRIVHQNGQLANLATFVALPVVALLILRQSSTPLFYPWLGVIALVTLLRALYLRLAQAHDAPPERIPYLRRNFLLWNFASGAAWGAAALLVALEPLPNLVFLAFTLGGVTAVAVVIHGAMFSAVALFTLPALLPLALRLLLQNGQPYTAMGIATFLFACILLAVAARMGKASLRAIRLGLVNEDLINYLEEAKKNADHLNSVLTSEVAERREIEHRLRTEHDFISAILDTECGLVVVVDPDGRLVRFNRACELVTGYYAHELIGRPIWDTLIQPSEAPYLKLKLEAVLAGAFPNECELRWRVKNGGERRVRLSNTALIDKTGRPTHIVATGVDVTDHYAAESELARSRENFRLLVEGVSSYAIYMLDTEGRITSWNSGAERITGYTGQDVIGTHFSRFYTVEDVQCGRPSIQLRMAASEGRLEYEGWNVRKGNGLFWASITVSPVRAPDNSLRGFSVITGDLTERKQTEDTIRALLAISEQLNATLDIDLLMESLLQQSLRLVDAGAGYAGLFQDGSVKCSNYRRGAEVVPIQREPRPATGLPAHVQRTRRPYRAAETSLDPLADRDFCRTYGVRAAICCPILNYGGEAIGFIEVHNKNNDGTFSAMDEERLVSVSQSAALAIQNALAYQQIKRTKNLLSEEARLMEMIATGAPLPRIIAALLGSVETHVEGTRAVLVFADSDRATGRRYRVNGQRVSVPAPAPDTLPALFRPAGKARADLSVTALEVDEHPDWRRALETFTRTAPDTPGLSVYPIRTQAADPVGMLAVLTPRSGNGQAERPAMIETVVHLAGIAIERHRAEENLRQSHERLRALSTHLQTVREQEKAHLARELHDELGSTLLALKIDASWIERHLADGDPALTDKAVSMTTLIDTAVSTTRRISSGLRPPMLDDLGLLATLEWQINEYRSRMGIACQAELTGESEYLNSAQSIALFRIFQEALTNVARHAGASNVRIQVHIAPDCAAMTITDNGKGLDPAAARRPDAHGVHGMYERIHALGGSIRLDGAPGRGTQLSVKIPLHNTITDQPGRIAP